MILGYNTNGFAHHSLTSAIDVLAAIGYRAVGITLDHAALNPFGSRLADELKEVRERLERHNMTPVIETGARYLLNPFQKHEPTLVSPGEKERADRVAFYRYAIDIAGALGATRVSLWSGAVHDGADDEEAYQRLVPGLADVLAYAREASVTVALEPEPGMLVDTLEGLEQLDQRLAAAGVDAAALRLTVDIGHLHCLGETPIADRLRRWRDRIANVHIEDMRAGVHEHLEFGRGEIDFAPIVAAFGEIQYAGPVVVELSRHSHDAPAAARRAYEFLTRLSHA